MRANHRQPIFDGMDERWANVSDGHLRYLVGGAGPPLVLVHGIAASSFSFRFNCTELMSEFRVLVPDLMYVENVPRRTALDGSLLAASARLSDFLQSVGAEKVHALASSHGGSVVLKLAAMDPTRFERVVLVSPANPFARHYQAVVRFYLSPLGRIFLRLAPFTPGRVWDYGIGRMYANPGGMAAGTGIGYARPLRTRGTSHYLLSCLKTFHKDIEGLRDHLPKAATTPTLLIWGDQDPVVEIESGYQLQRELGAEMIVMRGIGHLPYEEAPQEFNRIVLEYLRAGSKSQKQKLGAPGNRQVLK